MGINILQQKFYDNYNKFNIIISCCERIVV